MDPRTDHSTDASALPAHELVRGMVVHQRLRPVQHRFAYGVFYLRLRLTQLEAAGNACFSINRFNLASFHYRDHGARDGSHPLAWIRALLRREGLGHVDGEVWLQCFPRVLGYVFNPVSFWFCEDRAGRTCAILAEVNNTFGETHAYLLARADGAPLEPDAVLQARKVFHVSPFFTVSGEYRFRFRTGPRSRHAAIDYCDPEGLALRTCLAGQAMPLAAHSVLRALATHPFMTLGVMARIHWQALRLWLRRVPVHARPLPPLHKVTR